MKPKENAEHLLNVCKKINEKNAKEFAEAIILHSLLESLNYYEDEDRANHWTQVNRELEKL
jgi:hypothetical protein